MYSSKRIIAGLLAVVFCLSMMVVGISSVSAAESDITVSLNVPASVKQGDTVSVEVVLSSENEVDFAAGDFQMNFDPDVLSVEATDKMVTSYTAGEIVEVADNLSISNPQAGMLKVLYCDETDTQTGLIKADGVLAKIDFTVANDAPAGATEITFTENGDFVVPDADEQSGFKNFTVEYENASITVEEPEQTSTQAPSTQNPTDQNPTNQNPTNQNPTTTQKPNDSVNNNTNNPTQVKPDTDTPVVSAKKPAKVKKVTVKPGKKKITVKWKKAKNAKKYRVKYSYKKNMKKAKFKTVKKTKVVIKKLKSGKKVYVQVQGVNGKVKGKFSKKVSKKVK